jgi:chemotaxis protein CheD
MMSSISDDNESALPTKRRVNLLPGQMIIASSNKEIWTILGSCISIVLHSPFRRISAINHAQLPAPGFGEGCPPTCPRSCGVESASDKRYVTCSFELMLTGLRKLNVSPGELDVRLYGGAAMMALNVGGSSVGERNIAAAEKIVASHNLSFHFRDVGGNTARKLVHNSGTGETRIVY